MDEKYNALRDRILNLHKNRPQERLVIGVAGGPGSGKTTLAKAVGKLLNEEKAGEGEVPFVAVVPMDGFHLTRAQLDEMKDPGEAHKRRGAPWTFDGQGVVAMVKKLKQQKRNEIVKVPTFDHEIKDPVPNGLEVNGATPIVMVEGNYLLLHEEPWSDIATYLDEKWLIRVDDDLARMRVAKRHVRAGISQTLDEGLDRVDKNDALNTALIRQHSKGADIVIDSIEEN
ncbi:hypothetical protein TRICI_000659 [Trichomonascus ciferrii]|uniref:Phosphoribulokinase/uridine kinase domain-containing protein n=1 Tax=Trichomonascus ciferrii TaxID=44093 RepID=A0A642VBF1_9ASCO|nr:hypothetical protein TRICI_000659 [Trichomonascus ciferrii]